MRTVSSSTSLRVNGERSRTIKFYTVGCKVNQYDTQSIREKFLSCGFRELENSQPADIYVINTCTVTHKADRDSRRFIYLAHCQNPQAKIIVTGCYTELNSEEIAKIPGVSYIVKNRDKGGIVDLIGEEARGQKDEKTKRRKDEISYFKGHTRAFLKIQDGCDNLCSYCKVPLVRGQSRSKPLKEIVAEAERLINNGFKEIVLCGICLGAYGKDLYPKLNLADVIEAIEKIDGLFRIRLSSIEASDISDSLIGKMSQSQKLCHHLHIPIQSGDDEILSKMNRKISRGEYLKLIKKIKNQIPQIAITTDILVGFPGENEANFENTVSLIKEILPLKVHIFPYSRREGTLAACNFKDEIKPLIIKERISHLKNIAVSCANTYKKQFLNKKMDVLIEGRIEGDANLWEGYTHNYIKVLTPSEADLKNQLVSLTLRKITKDYILGEIFR